MKKQSKIYVAGHNGLVGSAVVRRLTSAGHNNIIVRSSKELDLRCQSSVNHFFAQIRPEVVFLAAAKVGGIVANSNFPAEFIGDNLQIQSNVVDAAYRHGVKKLLLLGSSCIYPKHCPQPIREDYLLTGPLEPTNEWYAIAKIAGIKLCQAYRKQYGFDAISAMPTNLYGPGDNFHPENSHVIPALLRRFHEAKQTGKHEVTIWGSGTPRREFLHVDDLANALYILMLEYSEDDHINVGCGKDFSIMELAQMVARTTGYTGHISLDMSKPDGTPQKLLDISRINRLGWKPQINLEAGLSQTYTWFQENQPR